MTLPPWHGSDEPDFLPPIRRHFAELLLERTAHVHDAAPDLRGGPGECAEAARRIFSVAHDLSGTATSLGADEMGEVATRLTRALRPWCSGVPRPEPHEVDAVLADIKRLMTLSEQYIGWVDSEEG